MKAPFCMAPFVHSHVNSAGINGLCCIADEFKIEAGYEADLDLDPREFWNSSYMRDRRKMMSAGETPPECHRCVKPHTNSVYKDTFFKANFEHGYEQKKRENLADDFSLSSPPESIDYRNSVCNLQCQTCDSFSSTTIAQTFKANEKMLQEHDLFFGSPENPKERSQRTFTALNELIERGAIRHAYFAGGEPTLVPGHLEKISALAQKAPTQVRLSYNTNLMIKQHFLEKWILLLDQFSEVYIFCSIDGVGDLGSYLRMGVDLRLFEQNLEFIIKHKTPNVNVMLDVTITSLGLFRLIELAKFAILHKLKVNARHMIPSKADFLLIEFLDKKTREALCAEFRKFYEGLPSSEQNLVENINAVMSMVESVDEFSNQKIHEALNLAKAYAKMYPDFPSFEDWLIRLKDENKDILRS